MKIIFFLTLFFLTSCKFTDVSPPKGLEPEPQRVSLSWESKPNREAWSDKTSELLKANLGLYDDAIDIVRVCPSFRTLSEHQKIKALGEFWVAKAYYESGFNPANQNVDVGTKENKDSWSIGLYQVSVRDLPNRQTTKYTFEELLTPLPNIILAHEIMRRQLSNHRQIFLPNSHKARYWAVILIGNKYEKITQILDRVHKNAPFCLS